MGWLQFQILLRVTGALLAAMSASLPVAGSAQTLRLGSGFEYTHGLYGSHLPTDSLIATASVRDTTDDWTFGIVIPYVRVSGPGAPFEPFAVSYFALAIPHAVDTNSVPLVSLPGDPSYHYPQFSPITEGIGDVTVSASRSVELKPNRLYLDASAALKLPTGDPQKLIGTGEPDVTLRSDLIYEAYDFGMFVGGGYTFAGKTPRFDLQDRWQFSTGAYKPLGQRFTVGVIYDWREPLIVHSKYISEITPYISARIDSRLSVLAYTVIGLSEASPDFGVGLRLAVDFGGRGPMIEID